MGSLITFHFKSQVRGLLLFLSWGDEALISGTGFLGTAQVSRMQPGKSGVT